MLPHLLGSDRAASAGAAPSHFPPPRFRPLLGPTQNVQLRVAPYIPSVGETAAQKSGLRYEALIQEKIRKEFPGYLAAPYIHFEDAYKARTAQPDGILAFDRHVFIVEIKYQHVPEAWWQLQRLYYPLVCRLWPAREVSLLEICRSFDPHVAFPVEVVRVDDLKNWVSEPRKEFGVLTWR